MTYSPATAKLKFAQSGEVVIPQTFWRGATSFIIGAMYALAAATWAFHGVLARTTGAFFGPCVLYLGYRPFLTPIANAALRVSLMMLAAVLAAITFSHDTEPHPGVTALDYLVKNFPFVFVAICSRLVLAPGSSGSCSK